MFIVYVLIPEPNLVVISEIINDTDVKSWLSKTFLHNMAATRNRIMPSRLREMKRTLYFIFIYLFYLLINIDGGIYA